MPEWQSTETVRLLPAAEEEMIARFVEAVTELDRLALSARAVLAQIRSEANDALRSANYEPPSSDGPAPWCWLHEQSHDRCKADESVSDELCPIEVVARPSDRTGEAATQPDAAARHHSQFIRSAKAITSTARALSSLVALYPIDPSLAETIPGDDGPGVEWCTNCWLDDKYHEPVAVNPKDGKPYYKGLCKPCGEFRSANGFDRPRNLSAVRHRGGRITSGMVASAVAEYRRLHPPKAKKSGKRSKMKGSAA